MQNINWFNRLKWKLYTNCILRHKAQYVGEHTMVFDPLRIEHPRSVSLGDNVFISSGTWIIGDEEKGVTLNIKNGVNIGNYAHIVALNDITIYESVLIADKVFITDSTHSFENIDLPIKSQKIRPLSSVSIGEGSWIGEGVYILGCSIGKHCVIGAGAVVTKDIPDYCIAVGNPAKVIKRYSIDKKEWVCC